MFVNREAELAHLEQLYATDQPHLFVLYGRRRVGKTELLRHFCQNKPHLFFVATLSAEREQLADFSKAVWRYTHPDAADEFTFPSWEAAFQALADLPDRPIIVMDEFTYLISGNRAIPSILQKVWDETLQHKTPFLILSGSFVGMMEQEVLGYRSPLYGRRTGNELLLPLELSTIPFFFPAYTPTQYLEAWAVLGGMPYYLQVFSDEMDLFENIRTHTLSTRGILYNEPYLLLREELREPRNYFSVLQAIAHGNTRLNAITQAAKIGDGRATARYLDVLADLRLIKRQVPATEHRPEKSRKGIYQITDPFLRFWFRFVHPHRTALELKLADVILEQRVRPFFDQFVSYNFEQAARDYVVDLAKSAELSFFPERVGGWWDRHNEIDVVAVNDTESAILVGECKWTAKPVDTETFFDLKHKAKALNRDGRYQHIEYALFSKNGFTPHLEAAVVAENVHLVHISDLFL